jgi:hypothetical protein
MNVKFNALIMYNHVPIVGIQFPNYFINVQNEFEVVGVAQNKELFNDAPKVEGQTNKNKYQLLLH